jgi:hypothetical protein
MIKRYLLVASLALFILFLGGCAVYHVPGHGLAVAPLYASNTHYHSVPVRIVTHHHGFVTKRIVKKRYHHKHLRRHSHNHSHHH